MTMNTLRGEPAHGRSPFPAPNHKPHAKRRQRPPQPISPELRGVDTDQVPSRWEWPDDPTIRKLLKLRQRAAADVERLLALLDDLDGDPDLEPYLADNGMRVTDDRELAEEERPPEHFAQDEDCEPSLGWTSTEVAFSRYSPVRDDREEECEDEGGQCDDEGDFEQDTSAGFDDWAPTGPRPTNRFSLDPSLMPDRYFMTGEGCCLDPIIKDGDRVLIDRREPIRPGDMVAIYLHRRFVPRGGHQVLMKRLVQDGRDGSAKLADGRPCVLVEMLNPSRLLAFPAEAVLALHRLVRVDNDSPGYRVTQGEMLAEAARRRSAQPIG